MLDSPGMQARCGGSEIFLYHGDFHSTVYSSLGAHEGHLVAINEFLMQAFSSFPPGKWLRIL